MNVLTQYGDLVSVVGALLLFFNWIATNIVTERFKAAKAAYSEGNLTFRLYQTLDSLHGAIESVASSTLNNGRDLYRFDRRQNEELDPVPYLENELLWILSTSSLNARQIDWGVKSCMLAVEQSSADRAGSRSSAELQKVYGELVALKDEKDATFERASAYVEVVRRERTLTEADLEGLNNVLDSYSEGILPRFGPLLRRFIDAYIVRSNELSEALRRSSQSLYVSKRVSVVLYILGSILVLFGTVLTKLV